MWCKKLTASLFGNTLSLTVGLSVEKEAKASKDLIIISGRHDMMLLKMKLHFLLSNKCCFKVRVSNERPVSKGLLAINVGSELGVSNKGWLAKVYHCLKTSYCDLFSLQTGSSIHLTSPFRTQPPNYTLSSCLSM